MSANQLYKDYKKSGGTLSFAEFMDREKKKNFVNFDGTANVPVNKNLSDSLQSVLSNMRKESGLKTEAENRYIFGIHKNIWLGAGITGLAVVGFIIYKNRKK